MWLHRRKSWMGHFFVNRLIQSDSGWCTVTQSSDSQWFRVTKSGLGSQSGSFARTWWWSLVLSRRSFHCVLQQRQGCHCSLKTCSYTCLPLVVAILTPSHTSAEWTTTTHQERLWRTLYFINEIIYQHKKHEGKIKTQTVVSSAVCSWSWE